MLKFLLLFFIAYSLAKEGDTPNDLSRFLAAQIYVFGVGIFLI